MMKFSSLRFILVGFCLLFSTLTLALDLDEAKQKGWVGEKDNGYLGLVVAEPEVQGLVEEVNKKRHAIYLNLANKNNIALEQVEKLAAKKAYAKTAIGHYIWLEGAWVKK